MPLDEAERRRKAEAARIRFEKATLALAAEGRFGGPNAATSEIEMLEEATRLVKDVTDSRGGKGQCS